jgi:hypothetical protein
MYVNVMAKESVFMIICMLAALMPIAGAASAAYPYNLVAAGGSYSLVISANDTVWAFGNNQEGQCDMAN